MPRGRVLSAGGGIRAAGVQFGACVGQRGRRARGAATMAVDRRRRVRGARRRWRSTGGGACAAAMAVDRRRREMEAGSGWQAADPRGPRWGSGPRVYWRRPPVRRRGAAPAAGTRIL